jgi:hypothetical protein
VGPSSSAPPGEGAEEGGQEGEQGGQEDDRLPEESLWGPVLREGRGVRIAEVRVTEADWFAPLVAKTL